MALQIIRTPEFLRTYIESIEKMGTKVAQTILKMHNFLDIDIPAYKMKYKKEYISLQHAQLLADEELRCTFRSILVNHIWVIGKNSTNEPFYTSDTPVVKRTRVPHPFHETGYASFGVEVSFPLTPKYMLIMYERKAFLAASNRDGQIIDSQPENVTYYNSLQVLHSYRCLYSPRGNSLSATEICALNPEVCIPQRDRVQVHCGI